MEKHSGRARELFKYIDTVRAIVRFGGYNWRAYDVQFRLRQARQPHRSWAAIDTELWLTVATAQPRGGYHAGGRPQALPCRGGAGVRSSRHNRTRLARGAYFFTSGRRKGQRRLQASASQSLLRIQCRHLPARSVPLCARVRELWLRLPRGGGLYQGGKRG